MRKNLIVAVLLIFSGMVACGGGKEERAQTPPSAPQQPAPPAASPLAPARPATPAEAPRASGQVSTGRAASAGQNQAQAKRTAAYGSATSSNQGASPPPPPPPASVPPSPAAAPLPPPPLLPPPRPTTTTLRAGATIDVRLTQFLSTAKIRPGDRFNMTLDRDLEVDGNIVARKGSNVVGLIADAEGSARVKGRAHLSLRLSEIEAQGESFRINSNIISMEAGGTKGRDTKAVAGTTGLGAIIGAIAGGGKGAAIGAVVGAGAGGASVLATKGKEVELEPEQRFTFRLEDDVEMKILSYAETGGSPASDQISRSRDVDALQQRLQSKISVFQAAMPAYQRRGGDPRRVQPIMEEFQRLMDEGRPAEAEAKIDQALAIVKPR